MTISMHAMAVGSFVPMLKNLSAILDKAADHAERERLDLVNARLAPDMYTLAQQIQQACYYAGDSVSRLGGRPAAAKPEVGTTLADLKAQIAGTIDLVGNVAASDFKGAEGRDCSIDIPNGLVIEMDGLRFLGSWSLPHFYFHVVTAYDILRHCGLSIGKMDYLSQVGGFIRPKERPTNIN
jgi:uncharacterized protein